MSGWYAITIEAWPFCSGNGKETDQDRAGPRERTFTIKLPDFDAAYAAAVTLQSGITSSGHVWKAPVQAIVYRGEMHP